MLSHLRLTDSSPTAFLKLADFGIAFEVMTRRLAGTPNYVPLEVWSAKTNPVMDKWVDAYASACVLFEMVEGACMVEDANARPRPPPSLKRKEVWRHHNGFLEDLFRLLHDKPERMHSNWFGWKSVREAVEKLMVVDYATGSISYGLAEPGFFFIKFSVLVERYFFSIDFISKVFCVTSV